MTTREELRDKIDDLHKARQAAMKRFNQRLKRLHYRLEMVDGPRLIRPVREVQWIAHGPVNIPSSIQYLEATLGRTFRKDYPKHLLGRAAKGAVDLVRVWKGQPCQEVYFIREKRRWVKMRIDSGGYALQLCGSDPDIMGRFIKNNMLQIKYR